MIDALNTATAQNLEAAVSDTKDNLPWIAGILAVIVVWGAISTFLFHNCEKDSQGPGWTLLRASYFTALNVMTGEFPDNINPKTRSGKVISVVNAGAGLLLLGCLIAVVTLAFQRSDPGTTNATSTLRLPAATMLIGSEADKLYFDSSSPLAKDIPLSDRRYFPDEEAARAAGFKRSSGPSPQTTPAPNAVEPMPQGRPD